jgi:hypothetical protein
VTGGRTARSANGFQLLLTSLARVNTYGVQLPIDVFMESSVDDETLRLADSFQTEWGRKGPVQVTSSGRSYECLLLVASSCFVRIGVAQCTSTNA